MQEQVLRVKLRILDAPKRQPVRGSGVAGIFAARAFERVTEFGDVVIALPDAEHGADHDANHVVKKTAARNIVNDTVPVAAPAGEKNRADSRFGFASRGFESRKIMCAEKKFSRGIELFNAERGMNMQRRAAQKSGGMAAVEHTVAVVLLLNGKARVKFRLAFTRHFKACFNANVGRQICVQCKCEFFGGNSAFGIKMRCLRPRVNAAVRAAGGMESEVFARNALECIADDLLNGNSVGLNLPANVACSVVFNYKYDSLHAANYTGIMCTVSIQLGIRNDKRGIGTVYLPPLQGRGRGCLRMRNLQG